ncbi:TRAP transporter large permease [Polaromonas eurypsychrophila]|uniref:TRAP transporter large permease protein n=1 Tax=Polaromonas eurypsychrophila TaxID=1614635 RepID=A0A916SBP8_9BURK|nr:TRAP transporter large permease [Polaromonas eurypsychrophila]GGA93248.1 C4-dicarboxylate ABC transporter permease [Polaromonas eurypsychrophila]
MNFASPFAFALYTILGLCLLGVPVGHAMIAGSVLYLYMRGMDIGTVAEQLLNGTNQSFLLLAIPLFILAAAIMSNGSILDRLLIFCNAIVGRYRGGLAQVNVLQSVVFSAMSGSALADAAGSGKLMQEMMTRDKKYTPEFAAALTAVSSVLGPILPPSIPLVLYALVSGTSIGYLFLAGILPGILLGAVQMGLIWWQAKSRNFPVEEKVPLRELPRITREAFPSLVLPLLLLGCMYTGITTPTEAAGIAAAYALVICVVLYKLRWSEFYDALLSSARMSISIGMLIAGALVFNYVITSENIPASLSQQLGGLQLSAWGFLLLVNVFLLLLGGFLEGSTIILVILPVLLPTAVALGIDPVHFGLVAVFNIMIGLCTPPFGLLLLMMMKVADVRMGPLMREVWPFHLVMIAALAVCTVWPDFVLVVPRMAGYSG